MNVLPTGAISKNLAGEELAPIGSLGQAGVVAITDDGHCIQNHELMRRAVEYARMVGLPVLDHCQDYNLVGNGVMHEGYWSTLLGLPGWPSAGEEAIVMRNILLAELCDHHIHCQHVSCGRQRPPDSRSARARRENQRRGLSASHRVDRRSDPKFRHQLQNESAVALPSGCRRTSGRNRRRHLVDPGSRSRAARAISKRKWSSMQAPFGIVGLETELGLFLDLLVHKHRKIDIARLIEMYTVEPAKLLRLDAGTLSVGAPADVTLIDPNLEWTVKIDKFQSASRNSPFDGWKLKGRAVRTIVCGKDGLETVVASRVGCLVLF